MTGTPAAGALRRVLAELRAVGGGELSMDELARRVGVSRTEAAAMVDYWVDRAAVSLDLVGRPATSCAGCTLRLRRGCGGCATGRGAGPES